MSFRNFIIGWGCGLVFILPFLLIGLGCLSFSLYYIFKTEQAKGWIQIPANVQKIDIDSHSNKGTVSYEVIAKYFYTIEGKKYSGDRIAFGYGMNNIDDHDGLFSRLQSSKRIIIYVNPNDKQESVIVPGMNDSIVGLLIFSILWNSFIVALGIVPLFVKGVDRNNKPKYTSREATLIIAFVWGIGIILLLSKCLHIDIESKINVIEEVRNIDGYTE